MQKKLGFLKKIIMAGLATLVLTGWGGVTAPAQTVPLISKDEVKEALTSPHVTIIDVRVAKDWNASDKKIQGAVREDPEKVESWAQKYQHYQDIILYCA